jgi:putative transposase
MNYVIKTKIRYPSQVLLESLNLNSNIARFTYNWLLGYCLANKCKPKEARDEFRKLVKNKSVYNAKTGEIYDDSFQEMLKSTPSQITDMESDKLAQAFKTVKKSKVLSFRSKHKSKQSFTLNKKNDSNFKLSKDGHLSIVKTGTIKLNLEKLRLSLLDYDIQRITITESSYGWYISILIRIPDDIFLLPNNDTKIGIDWGIKAFASDSDGNQFRIPDQEWYKCYIKLYNRLKHLQSILGKKRNRNKEWKNSKKYKNLKFKIKSLYEHLANIRKDFLHTVSKYYVTNYGSINIEDLRPSNLLKNHKLARMIAEGMFYTWKVILTYKCLWYGRVLNIINPSNTSQICNKCGTKLKTKLKLSQRVFKCTCGHKEDRDINAAKNILALA